MYPRLETSPSADTEKHSCDFLREKKQNKKQPKKRRWFGLSGLVFATVSFSLSHTLQLREHLAKGQRTLAGEGMSQIVRSLLELLQRRSYYSGDLLFSTEILRNVTDTFKRATYIPAPDDVQVRGASSRKPPVPPGSPKPHKTRGHRQTDALSHTRDGCKFIQCRSSTFCCTGCA